MSAKAMSFYAKYCNNDSQEEVKKLYIAALDAYDIHWMGVLSGTESVVLYFILKRTVKFGKTEVAIPLRHFREGVKVRDTGEVVISGLKLKHETVTTALTRLQSKGLITFERKGEGNTYEHTRVIIHLDVYLASVEVGVWEEATLGKLPVPRSKKFAVDCKNGDENDSEKGGAEIGRGGAEIGMRKQHKVNDVNKIKNKTLPVADAPGFAGRESFTTAAEAIATSNLRIRRTREAKASRAASATGVLKMDDFRALWQQCMLRHWPTVPVVASTRREWGMFSQALKTVTLTLPVSDVVEFAIANWPTLINTQFGSYKNVKASVVGAAPSMNFFLQNFRKFVEAVAIQKATTERVAKVTEVTPEKQQENENAALRRQIAQVTAENRKLTEKARRDERIMQEMDRKKDAAPAPARRPLTRAQLRPIEDDDNLPRNWNGQ